jgi:hypothetical protein
MSGQGIRQGERGAKTDKAMSSTQRQSRSQQTSGLYDKCHSSYIPELTKTTGSTTPSKAPQPTPLLPSPPPQNWWCSRQHQRC